MSTPVLAGQLLATLDRNSILNAMRSGLDKEQGTGTNVSALVAVIVAAIALMLVLLLVSRLRQRPGVPTVTKVDPLARMARVLGLGRRELNDLRTLANRAHHPHPAALLLSPGTLANGVERALADGDDPSLRQRANALCQRVFGCGLPEPGADADGQDAPDHPAEQPPAEGG